MGRVRALCTGSEEVGPLARVVAPASVVVGELIPLLPLLRLLLVRVLVRVQAYGVLVLVPGAREMADQAVGEEVGEQGSGEILAGVRVS